MKVWEFGILHNFSINKGEALSGQTSIQSTEIKNGSLSVCVTTQAPPTPTAREVGCPNNNWSTSIQNVEFTSAQIIVEQNGQVVLSQTFNP